MVYNDFMAKKYVIALDQGTTSSRAIIYNQNAHPLRSAQKEFTQFYPKPGWVEHDPEEIFKSQLNVMQSVIIDNDIKMGGSGHELRRSGIYSEL